MRGNLIADKNGARGIPQAKPSKTTTTVGLAVTATIRINRIRCKSPCSKHHSAAAVQPVVRHSTLIIPCGDFFRNRCKRGEYCKLGHAPLLFMSAEDFGSFLSQACPQAKPAELKYLWALSDKDKLGVVREGEMKGVNDIIGCCGGRIKRANADSSKPEDKQSPSADPRREDSRHKKRKEDHRVRPRGRRSTSPRRSNSRASEHNHHSGSTCPAGSSVSTNVISGAAAQDHEDAANCDKPFRRFTNSFSPTEHANTDPSRQGDASDSLGYKERCRIVHPNDKREQRRSRSRFPFKRNSIRCFIKYRLPWLRIRISPQPRP